MVATIPPFIQNLKSQLQGSLPGVEAQKKMAPVPRSFPKYSRLENDAILSAVLILLFPRRGRWFFILTERSSNVEHHRGQISLPGGAQEDGESLEQTALRETWEELGIDTENISVLGELTPLFIPGSGFRVHPIVAWNHEEPFMRPDPVEVNSVHIVSVDQLLDDSLLSQETRKIRGYDVYVPYFHFDHIKVWGATATILSELREILFRIPKG